MPPGVAEVDDQADEHPRREDQPGDRIESGDDDDDDSGYFSDGELSSSQEIEVKDDYFFKHLLDDAHNDTAFVMQKKQMSLL